MFTVEDPPRSHKLSDKRRISKKSSSKNILSSAHLHDEMTSPSHEADLENTAEDDIVEDCCEAQVLIRGGDQNQNKVSHLTSMPSSGDCLQPVVLLLGVGACLRHSAGYTWGYNSALYFQTYFPFYASSNIWLSWITILGGSLGVILGGYMSDRLVTRMGIASRALVLAGSQLLAAPFALGLLYLDPPYAFLSLFIGYLFGKTSRGYLYF